MISTLKKWLITERVSPASELCGQQVSPEASVKHKKILSRVKNPFSQQRERKEWWPAISPIVKRRYQITYYDVYKTRHIKQLWQKLVSRIINFNREIIGLRFNFCTCI